MMTVKQLMEVLKEMPPNHTIVIHDGDGGETYINDVDIIDEINVVQPDWKSKNIKGKFVRIG